ncbi:pentapeptide repeat-containing protein [Manganibacter manganicus]|uniref:pentapeptide repeat-containing protein n=1 Tax=Manganibacter manganicus TaxID=1873176 RepID=UPI001FD89352|nr:pentapeptide repeat-containing protein [Pseudaminobacter manganicus]
MADFVAVLKKTLDGLGETTSQTRARVYDKARSTIEAKLAAISPTPPQAVADRQRRALEDAIATVEKGYEKPKPMSEASDPLAELESIFSSIDRNRTQPNHVRPTAKATASAQPGEAATPQEWPAVEPVAHEPKAEPGSASNGSPPKVAATSERPADPVPASPAVPVPPTMETDDAEETFPGIEEDHGYPADVDEERSRRRLGGLIAALVALVVIAGGGYAAWLNKDVVTGLFDKGDDTVAVQPVKEEPTKPVAGQDTPTKTPDTNSGETESPQKFTQRLLPDGKEVDPGPATAPATIGEGSSVVALTTPPSGTPTQPPVSGGEPATPPAGNANQPAVAVGQKAIYYEERTNAAEGSAESGTVVWSLVQESPGGDAPPEPAIRGEATIPGKNVQLRITIRRNTDKTLPASHIIEMIFLTPDGFEGGSIDNVLRIAMKRTEQDAGNPLLGIPAKIADGYFLVALNDTKADEATNLALLRNQEWIDIPVIYKSGRRALLTMEKGIPGDKVFDEALKAWESEAETTDTGGADTGDGSAADTNTGNGNTGDAQTGNGEAAQ